MTQRSFHWDGASVGDADALATTAPDGIGWRMSNEDYESLFVDRMSRALWNGTGDRGVLSGWTNELVVTGVATPISIDTGAAIVYGMLYRNTVLVNEAIATPTTNIRYDRVVIRRDWAAQTARITVITGVEGAGIPAMIQSPAPSGTGIYDIPLATIEVDLGGNIAVTDARDYCTFPSGFDDDAFGTAQLTNDSVDWADRPTETKVMFIGGGDLQPNVNAGWFAWGGSTTHSASWQQVGPPPWGTGAANEEAWRLTGASALRRGVYTTFMVPLDIMYTTQLTFYLWWVNNAVAAASFTYYIGFQSYTDDYGAGIAPTFHTYTQESVTSTGAVNDVFRTGGLSLYTYGTGLVDRVMHCYINWYNSAGAEDVNLMGIEIQYEGYV